MRTYMCIASTLYVSRFSSDTRCRDLKIKSQSVCHLLTLLSLPLPCRFLLLLPFSLTISLASYRGRTCALLAICRDQSIVDCTVYNI